MDRLRYIASCILSLFLIFFFFLFIVLTPFFLKSCATVNTANGGSTISTKTDSIVRNNSNDSSTTDVDINPTVDFSRGKK